MNSKNQFRLAQTRNALRAGILNVATLAVGLVVLFRPNSLLRERPVRTFRSSVFQPTIRSPSVAGRRS